MFKQVTLTNKCLAIVMQRTDANGAGEKQTHHRSTSSRSSAPENGFRIFQDFQDENRASFWNPGLVQSVNALEFVGFVRPGTLFVSGSELHLECLRGAWARRVLKPPPGFIIKRLGDIGGIEMQEVPQTQFIPLPEVLCLIVSNLNRAGEPATLKTIVSALTEEYDGMCIPKQEVLYATLGALIAEGKLYCMGEHYFIPTPTMFQYYQQQFLRRTAANPPSYLWTKDQEAALFPRGTNAPKSQEMCSRECQTGASVVCGQAPYVPPNKRDQATSAQTQTMPHPETVTASNDDARRRNLQSQANKDKNLVNKENKGFLSRLFGRTKTKNGTEELQKGSTRVITDGDYPNGTHPVNDRPSTSGPANVAQPFSSDSVPPANVPMATFSAQFPPPEWLCDPRFVKSATAKETNQQQLQQPQQPFLSKIRRTSKEPLANTNGQSACNRDQQRHSVWVDPIEGAVHGKLPSNFNRRERSNEPSKRCFASQRYYESRNQHGQLSPNENYDRYHRSSKQRHRLSKYLSSSSECLRESPYQSQHKKSTGEDRKRTSSKHYHDRGHSQQQPYSVYQFPQPSQHPLVEAHHSPQMPQAHNGDLTPKAEHGGGEKQDFDESKERRTLEKGSKPMAAAVVVVSRIPPLALPTDPEFDTVSECGGQRTSTPTPKKPSNARPCLETEINDPNPQLDHPDTGPDTNKQLTIENVNGHRDSAYSASPVVTEMSSSDGKYSSWSGSDGQREHGPMAVATSPESVDDEKPGNVCQVLDNTYVNDTQTRRCALDHTYENLDHGTEGRRMDETKYENVSTEHIEAPVVEASKEVIIKATATSSIHAYVSSV